jgi:hypothetical protein
MLVAIMLEVFKLPALRLERFQKIASLRMDQM